MTVFEIGVSKGAIVSSRNLKKVLTLTGPTSCSVVERHGSSEARIAADGGADDDGAVVRMFSVSLINGALGDEGQNYKNLASISRDLASEPSVVYGCGLGQDYRPVAMAR